MNEGNHLVTHRCYRGNTSQVTVRPVIAEASLTVYVNQHELVTLMCTPVKLNYLVLGFLLSEGLIATLDEVLLLRVCEEEGVADVRLNRADLPLPTKRILTSGCTGGVTFDTTPAGAGRSDSSPHLDPQQVARLVAQLQRQAELYRLTGGVHTSALADERKLLAVAEDVGRHNTLDKIRGECLFREIETRDRILLTTGRISSEMLSKAARMAVPIIVSSTYPTSMASQLAH